LHPPPSAPAGPVLAPPPFAAPYAMRAGTVRPLIGCLEQIYDAFYFSLGPVDDLVCFGQCRNAASPPHAPSCRHSSRRGLKLRRRSGLDLRTATAGGPLRRHPQLQRSVKVRRLSSVTHSKLVHAQSGKIVNVTSDLTVQRAIRIRENPAVARAQRCARQTRPRSLAAAVARYVFRTSGARASAWS
jgi:hypothetical protein